MSQPASGTLTLVPTPIDESSALESGAFSLLQQACALPAANVIVVEDLRPGRRRWLRWGLPRSALEHFVTYNEHNATSMVTELRSQLLAGKNVFLLSDGGLPAFCDPGRQLVEICHQNHIPVTATTFPNSVILALALSGFSHQRFYFAGFLPRKSAECQAAILAWSRFPDTLIVLDTPYHLASCLKHFAASEAFCQRLALVALNLNYPPPEQRLVRGTLKQLAQENWPKGEFVLVIAPPG